MRLNRIIVEKLYGFIDKEINFNEDITLLVGINGSGKTSILNLLSWITKPSLPNLCITEFKSIKLFFTYNKKFYEIECKHLTKKFEYRLKCQGSSETFHPLVINTEEYKRKRRNDNSKWVEEFHLLHPEKKEEKTWEFINKLPSPTVIGLDRNLYTEGEEGLFVEKSNVIKIGELNDRKKQSPIERVKDIVNTEYRKSKNSILNLTSDLKNHLMLSAFEVGIYEAPVKRKKLLSIDQVEKAEKRVFNFFSNFERTLSAQTDSQKIFRYFSNLKENITKLGNNPKDKITSLLCTLNSNHFDRLNNLLVKFEQFEKDSKEILERINLYLKTLNSYYQDSCKQLLFKEDTSEITFNTIGRDGKILTEHNDISALSSGEQQLLILFSYLAFNNQDGKLFIIDEPELSLHIKWQESFLDTVENVAPTTQIVFATHSPILVSKKKEKAVLLLPYNEE